MTKKFSFALFLFFIIAFFAYFLTSSGKTPYDYFVRLADAFLQGRYWLTDNPSWLSELIPAGPNKFYVVYPPMPAILLIPAVKIIGLSFPQQYLAHLLGAWIIILTMIIAMEIKRDKLLAVWSGLLIGFSSIVWFLSSVGSSWYLGQITAVFFLTAALTEVLDKKRPYLLGIFLGAAYLSRVNTILALPFFLYLLWQRDLNLKPFLSLVIFLSPFVLFNAYYNYLRFGVPWDQAYFLLPIVLKETSAPWFAKGVMNPAYIMDNFRIAFWSFPKIIHRFPFLQPSWAGLAIWITSPAFIFALKAPIKDISVKLSWLTIIIMFLFVSLHGGTGFAQFGYRFAVDFYPFLIFLTIKSVAQSGLKWHHWLLLFVGIIVNLWGVLWINKFGWVGF